MVTGEGWSENCGRSGGGGKGEWCRTNYVVFNFVDQNNAWSGLSCHRICSSALKNRLKIDHGWIDPFNVSNGVAVFKFTKNSSKIYTCYGIAAPVRLRLKFLGYNTFSRLGKI